MEAGTTELTGEIVTGLPEAPLVRPAGHGQGTREASGGTAIRARRGLRLGGVAFQRRSLALADMTASALALVIGITIVGDDQLTPLALLGLPLVVLASKTIGLYDREELVLRKSTLEDAPKLFQLATLYALVIWLLENTVVVGTLGHRQVLGLWGVFVLSSLLARASARTLCQAFAPKERCLVMGDPDSADELRRKFESDTGVNATVVGSVGLEEGEGEVPWTAPNLQGVLEEYDAQRVVIAPRHADSHAVLDVVRTLSSLGVRVSVCPRLLEAVGSSVQFDDVNGVPVLGIHPFGISRSTRLLKRTLDLLGAGIGLLVISPLMVLVAVAIKFDTPGPVFFRQRRVGRDGREFEIVKFRTMVDGADQQKAGLRDLNEADGLFKIDNDPRVTAVGRLLRRCSLDELPQLLNVVRGEMSLVGPRPLVGEEDRQVRGWERGRLQLTPGMTGPWQVLGSARVPLHEMVKIDYLYTANWSLWTDVKLLLRTLPYMARGRGQ
jgi:exopolysaccharide biosynthesis polyprenyl glycosylphosphotransferase